MDVQYSLLRLSTSQSYTMQLVRTHKVDVYFLCVYALWSGIGFVAMCHAHTVGHFLIASIY